MANWSKNTFEGGLNQDKEERALAPNEYSYALNIRNAGTEGGNVGVITNVKGNESVSFTLPSGSNKVIGSFSDTQKERVFYYVWNSSDTHSVLLYNVKEDSISVVMQTSELGFTPTNYITSSNIIYDDDNGDLLFFTDGNDEPKKINIDAGLRRFDTDIYQGLWSAGTFSEDEVVYFDINSFRYWYIAESSTTNTPYTTTTNPAPNDDWAYAPIGYVYPDTIEKADITAMPQAPKKAPDVAYGDRWDLTYNRLEGKMWQFAYKWIYSDNTESAYSPFSEVPFPLLTVSPFDTNQSPRFAQNNNELTIWCDRNSGSLVKKVRVIARYGGDDFAPTDFFLIDEFDVYNPEGIEQSPTFNTGFARVTFRNDEVYTSINVQDSNSLFSWIPRTAKAQELVNGNRIVWANILEGYPLDVTKFNETPPNLTFLYKDFPSTASLTNTFPAVSGSSFTITAPSSFNTGDIIEIVLPYRFTVAFAKFDARVLRRSYVVRPSDTQDTIGEAIKDLINRADYETVLGANSGSPINIYSHFLEASYDSGTNLVSVTTATVNSVSAVFRDVILAGVNTEFSAEIGSNATPYSSHKRGSTHKYGIVYSDDFGRLSTVYSNDTLENYVRTFGESDIESEGLGSVLAEIEINHAPPSWATKYHIVRTKSTPNHIYVSTSIGNTDQSPFDADYFRRVTKGGSTFIDISIAALNGNGDNSFNNAFSGSILNYSFTSGDRVRFVYSEDSGKTYYSDDVEIIAYDETVPYITVRDGDLSSAMQAVLANPAAPTNAVQKLLMEIYTPEVTNDNDLFYEIGLSFDIVDDVNGNKVHDGNFQSQIIGASAQPAQISVNKGDVYFKPRAYVVDASNTTELYYVEDLNFSDFYSSSFTDIGRPNLLIKEESTNERKSGTIGQIQRPTVLRYSEPFVPETNINGLSTVFDLNFYEYDRKFNSIQHLYSEGDRLIILQEDKVGFVLAGRQIVQSLSSSQSIGQSDEILSDIQYYAGEYGISENPESFAVNGFRKYFTDVNRGVVCRLSQDGITPISIKGMDDYFKSRFNEMYISEEKEIALGVYDKRFDEYIIKSVKFDTVSFTSEDLTLNEPEFSITFNSSVYDTSNLFVGQIIDMLASFDISVSVVSIVGQTVTFRTFSSIDYTEITTSQGRLAFYLPISETIAYNERLGAWSTFYSYNPEWISESALDLVSWRGGSLWKHNTNATRNNWYGKQFDSVIETVCNDNPDLVKSFLNMKISTTDNFYANTDDVTTSNGQVSDIQESDFKNFEGHKFAPFFRDRLTGGNNTYSGDKLKGSWVKTRLTNEQTEEIDLFAISYEYILSQFTR